MRKQLWDSAIVGTIVTLWKHSNTIYHDNRHNDLSRCTSMIRREIRAAAVLITGHSFNCIADLQILKTWNLNAILPSRAPRIQPCWWTPPRNGIVKINCDGSSLDNPGTAGLGTTYRIASVWKLPFKEIGGTFG
ncbi:hypothetical protein IFM89_034697 [Coptis chinensis]|uniref:RNase H type-1 domain-containing protein n=1 Tax=Coptis chinensis TaxID=261450 RepID=A0A835LKA2_9MAGN|nr:hypothetical protein IFM89_034697 [Coptis chinensis]